MKAVVAFIVFVAVAQAKSVSNEADLEFANVYMSANPRHTAEEWDAIYAAAEANVPEDTTGLAVGTVPQPEDAGKVFVSPAERIIGGAAVSQGQIPWQALVIMSGSFMCGGSLISSEWIFTAAHCVQGHNSFQITLGSTSRSVAQLGVVSQNARQALIHSNFVHTQTTIANDVGLLRLASPVAFSNIINPIRLPRHSQASTTFAGSAAVASGFGRINSANQATSPNLLFINVNVLTNAVCASTFGANIRANTICTLGANGRTPCNGDSGGPLVVQEADGLYTLVGAVSFGVEHCLVNFPSVYARVSSFLSWISSNTGIAIRA